MTSIIRYLDARVQIFGAQCKRQRQMAETTACFATRPGVRLVSLGEYSICITHDMIQHRFSCRQQPISAKRGFLRASAFLRGMTNQRALATSRLLSNVIIAVHPISDDIKLVDC